MGVITHELLHSLIDKYEVLAPNDGSYFEEALLDYFCPNGILAEKLGLTKKMDIGYYHSRNTNMRPYSLEMSKRLLSHIEAYYNISPKETIWQFLSERGFEKYINVDPNNHALMLLEKGFKMGKMTFKNRAELYER